MTISYSQPATGQDRWVIERLDGRRHGYFVEVGANDGIRHSNTLLLERQFQWNGLLIEADPTLYGQMVVNRPSCRHKHAVIAMQHTERHLFYLGGQFGGLARTMPPEWVEEHRRRATPTVYMQGIPLEDALVEAHCPLEIDYLSLDTEGSEYEILRGAIRSEYTFKLITVEFRYDSILLDKLQELLQDHVLEKVEAWDAFFVHRSLA